MALKDLSSLYDLVGGNQPVGDMENQQGGPQFNLGENSTLQEDNLVNLNSQLDYPDLNGIDGGNGYFYDIDNPPKGKGKVVSTNSTFKGEDLHIHLLTKEYSYTYGNNSEVVGPSPGETGHSVYQDLDGVNAGNGFFHGTNQLTSLQGKQLGQQDLHISLLENTPYTYAYGIQTQGNQPGQAGPYYSNPIDLDGGLPSSGKYVDKFDKLR